MTPAYLNDFRRATLPELLFVRDVALVLDVGEAAARRAIRRGDCGRFLRVGRRLAVRRPEFLRALDDRQIVAVPLRVLPRSADRATPCGRCGHGIAPSDVPGGSTHARELLCRPCATSLDDERTP